jgi:hypothetical protein
MRAIFAVVISHKLDLPTAGASTARVSSARMRSPSSERLFFCLYVALTLRRFAGAFQKGLEFIFDGA